VTLNFFETPRVEFLTVMVAVPFLRACSLLPETLTTFGFEEVALTEAWADVYPDQL
jgi:hypothetical protein